MEDDYGMDVDAPIERPIAPIIPPTPSLLIKTSNNLQLTPQQKLSLKLANTKYTNAITDNGANQIALDVLTELKSYLSDSNNVIDDFIKTVGSNYYQKKFINESIDYSSYVKTNKIGNGSEFYFIDLRKSVQNLLEDQEILELLWREKHGNYFF